MNIQAYVIAIDFFVMMAAAVIQTSLGIGFSMIASPILTLFIPMKTCMAAVSIAAVIVGSYIVLSLRKHLNWKLAIPAAIGLTSGRVLGVQLLMLQAIVLGIVTLLTLIYSLRLRERFPSYHVTNPIGCLSIGAGMGLISAFLGIGGGPINLAVLFIAFSMETKKAAANSLYIIMFSQLASLVTSLTKSSVPDFPPIYLIAMVSAGISGGLIGCRLNKRISSELTDKLFAGLLCVIILICIYNVVRFAAMC